MTNSFSRMKFALVEVRNPHRRKENIFPPLGLAYIAAYVRKRCPTIDVKIFTGDIMKQLDNYQPDIVGLSSVTQNFTIAREYAAKIKSSYKIPIIIGGIHISSLPHTLPKEFDIAVIGEGEETTVELLNLFGQSGFDRNILAKIDGISFHFADKIILNKLRKPIQNLDSLPYPARDLFAIRGEAHIITSRGCPYKCCFCSSSNFWKQSRYYSPQYVAGEIREIIEKYKIHFINIYDDLFIANMNRFRKIVDLLDKSGLNKKAEFACASSTNLINEETCLLLKKMGVKIINFGMESGSTNILRYLKKNVTTVEDHFRAVALCKKYGLEVIGSFIVGSPEETINDLKKTLDFIRKSNIDGGGVYPLTPYPGTEVWDFALEKGLVSENMEWGILDVDTFNPNKNILLAQKYTRAEFYEYYNKISAEFSRKKRIRCLRSILILSKFIKYFKNPQYVFKKIKELFWYD